MLRREDAESLGVLDRDGDEALVAIHREEVHNVAAITYRLANCAVWFSTDGSPAFQDIDHSILHRRNEVLRVRSTGRTGHGAVLAVLLGDAILDKSGPLTSLEDGLPEKTVLLGPSASTERAMGKSHGKAWSQLTAALFAIHAETLKNAVNTGAPPMPSSVLP